FFRSSRPPYSETCPLSLHDALPIFHLLIARRAVEVRRIELGGQRGEVPSLGRGHPAQPLAPLRPGVGERAEADRRDHLHLAGARSEEHTSELQSRGHLVCRLLLEKK